MWSVIEGHQGAIPRYVLVDAAGKIFRKEAARPSEDQKLAKQIEKLLAERN